jgi:ribosomal protein S18 acetylase RimI-like enzyme
VIPVTIRKANAEDVPVIHALLTELERTLGAEEAVQRTAGDLLRFGFCGSPVFDVLLAWQDRKAVGLALYFREFSSWRGAPGVYVQDLYVSAGLRGAGVGRNLMQAVMDSARTWGASYCKLSVYGDNEPAIAFYRRLGFRVSETECVLVLDDLGSE